MICSQAGMEMINYMAEMQMMFFREDQARIFLTVVMA